MTRAKMIQFEEELVVSLTKLIPLEMYCFNGECGLAEYISGLNSYLENMIFLKTIEVPEECVVYRC